MTSQNSLQLLVSKKCDLADSIGSDLTSIELLFACIAEVVEGLTAAFERRPDSVVRKFARKPSFCLPTPPRTRLPLPGFDACRRTIFGLLGDVADVKYATLVRNVDLPMLAHSSGRSNSKRYRRIFGSGGQAIRGKLMHYAFRDMFGKVKSSMTATFIVTTMVPSSKTTTASLIGGGFKKAPRFAMKRAPHVELRVAPRRTPHRLDFGLAELVRLVVFRRSDGKPSNSAATCPWAAFDSLPSRAKLKKALTNTIRLTTTRSA